MPTFADRILQSHALLILTPPPQPFELSATPKIGPKSPPLLSENSETDPDLTDHTFPLRLAEKLAQNSCSLAYL
jgi:hypothetical protein